MGNLGKMTTFFQNLAQRIGNSLLTLTTAEPLAQEYKKEGNGCLEQKVKDQHGTDDLGAKIGLSQVSGPTDIENDTSVPPTSQHLDGSLQEPNRKREALGKANIKDLALIKNLKAEKDSLYAMMTEQQSAFREKESKLQNALDDMTLLNQELQEKYDGVRKKADHLQQELDKEFFAHCDTLAGTTDLMTEVREDRQKQETPEQNESSESRERILLNALDTFKASCEEIHDMYNSDVSSTKQKSERLEMELLNEILAHQETKSQLVTLNNQQNVYIKKIAELEEELSAKRKADVFSKQQVERLHEEQRIAHLEKEVKELNETDVLPAKKQVGHIQKKLDHEIQNHSDTKEKKNRLTKELKADTDKLQKKKRRKWCFNPYILAVQWFVDALHPQHESCPEHVTQIMF